MESITRRINGKTTIFTFESENEEYIYFKIEDKFSLSGQKFPKSHCINLNACANFYELHKGNLNRVLKEIRKNKTYSDLVPIIYNNSIKK